MPSAMRSVCGLSRWKLRSPDMDTQTHGEHIQGEHTERERTQGERAKGFIALLRERLVILDGAMGTMIQGYALNEAQFRGERFAAWRSDLRGNNDLLAITQPDIIAAIHREYLLAGADVISTNTFNSSAVSQSDYGMEALVGELNWAAASLARRVADEVTAQTGK